MFSQIFEKIWESAPASQHFYIQKQKTSHSLKTNHKIRAGTELFITGVSYT